MKRYSVILLVSILINLISISAFAHKRHLDTNVKLIFRDDSCNQKRIPILIPLSKEAQREDIKLKVTGIDSIMTVNVSVGVRFDNDLSDTTRSVRPVEVYLKVVVLPDGTVLYAPKTMNKNRHIWVQIEKTFTDWMYQQPFDLYYNREQRSPLYPDIPVKSLVFNYKVQLEP